MVFILKQGPGHQQGLYQERLADMDWELEFKIKIEQIQKRPHNDIKNNSNKWIWLDDTNN